MLGRFSRGVFLRLLTAAALLYGGQALAVPDDPFPRPPELKTAIGFWTDVYARYSEHEIVFHHPEHLDVVYKILDLSQAAQSFANEDDYRKFRQEQVRVEKERIQEQLLELAKLKPGAHIPKHLVNLEGMMRKVPGNPRKKFTAAADWVRAQRGLREKFARAIQEAGVYMPYIERVFAENGLPRMLTRLPYVESSFERKAYSRSGAAGVWQFMPGSARQYMRYDEVADQRRDPWFSTHAAVGHLSDDYELLQDWPLAITAYNYGRNGLARAREKTGIDSLVGLIEKWDGPRWGFAAKNYYAEFLAALEVEQNAERYFGPLVHKAPERFEEVTTPAYLEYNTLVNLSGLSAERFAWLNPSFSRAVRDGGLLVPKGQVIRAPVGQGVQLARSMAQLPASQKFGQQRAYFARYRVRRGDSLSRIAQRHRTSVRSIMRSNNLRSASLIRVGQILKIPTGKAQGPVKAPEYGYHTVRNGETLWGIARRYGSSVSRLMADNDIGSANRLRVGQRLKVVQGGEGRRVAHRVRVGETLSQIATRYGTSVAQIRKDNQIRNANFLRLGQVLQINVNEDAESSWAPLRHKVRSGQTLQGIAHRYGVSFGSLIRYNNIRNPDHIRVGQWLTIPRS